jgi:hypothetical protein
MEVLMGKTPINVPFSMAMLNNQRVLFLFQRGTTNQYNGRGWKY